MYWKISNKLRLVNLTWNFQHWKTVSFHLFQPKNSLKTDIHFLSKSFHFNLFTIVKLVPWTSHCVVLWVCLLFSLAKILKELHIFYLAVEGERKKKTNNVWPKTNTMMWWDVVICETFSEETLPEGEKRFWLKEILSSECKPHLVHDSQQKQLSL